MIEEYASSSETEKEKMLVTSALPVKDFFWQDSTINHFYVMTAGFIALQFEENSSSEVRVVMGENKIYQNSTDK